MVLVQVQLSVYRNRGEKAKHGVKETSNTDVVLPKNYFIILTVASLCKSGTSNKHATVFQKNSPPGPIGYISLLRFYLIL